MANKVDVLAVLAEAEQVGKHARTQESIEQQARALLAEAYGSIGMEHTGDRIMTHGAATLGDEAALIAIAAAIAGAPQ
jgi:uncharacterized membrane protein